MIIGISQLEVFCIIGCNSDERLHPQRLYIDLKMTVLPPEKDLLDETIDYEKVARSLQLLAETGKFQLLESLARALSGALLNEFSMLEAVSLKIMKPNALKSAAHAYVEYGEMRK